MGVAQVSDFVSKGFKNLEAREDTSTPISDDKNTSSDEPLPTDSELKYKSNRISIIAVVTVL